MILLLLSVWPARIFGPFSSFNLLILYLDGKGEKIIRHKNVRFCYERQSIRKRKAGLSDRGGGGGGTRGVIKTTGTVQGGKRGDEKEGAPGCSSNTGPDCPET